VRRSSFASSAFPALRLSGILVALGFASACALTMHCSKSSGSKSADGGEAGLAPVAEDEDGGAAPMTEAERTAWSEADGGEPAELARLVDLVGCDGLRERASGPGGAAVRSLALRAMSYCPDFSELPWLADLASTASDDVAAQALDAIVDQAARPRRAVDPEDADELHTGCAALLALAKAPDKARPRRIGAVRALRMLVDRGCVRVADIPTDVDAK
jgi:hypothetical protein